MSATTDLDLQQDLLTQATAEVHAYVRVSTKAQAYDSQLNDIAKVYPDATVAMEKTSGTVPANEREVLGTMIKHTLRAGDTLVVWWIDRLGRDYDDVTETMRTLIKRGVTIQTINGNKTFDNKPENRVMTDIMITLYADQAANERANRLASAQAGREAIKSNPELWSKKFAGRKANEDQYTAIIEALAQGNSVRKTAEKLGLGVSTVQRAKKRHSEAKA